MGYKYPYNEKKKASNKRWDAENLARLSLAIPKNLADRMKEHTSNVGISVNGYIRHLIEADLEYTGNTTQTAPGCQDTPLPLGTTRHGEN